MTVQTFLQIEVFYGISKLSILDEEHDAARLALTDSESSDEEGRERSAGVAELPEKSTEEKTWDFQEFQGVVRMGDLVLQAIRNLCKR